MKINNYEKEQINNNEKEQKKSLWIQERLTVYKK